jgi:hypothetical protein
MKNKKNFQDLLKVLGRSRGYSPEELIQDLPRHKNFTSDLIDKIKKAPEVVLRNSGTLFAKKLIKMMKDLNKEAYRAKQFTRTELNDRGVLYGVVLLKHQVMDIVLNYFHTRWPQCVICLYNEYTQKTSVMNEKGVIWENELPFEDIIEKISKKRSIMPYFKDIQCSGEEIFETLYKSQFIEERDNPNFFEKMIPKNCYKLPGMRDGVEKRFNYHIKKLDDFLDSS